MTTRPDAFATAAGMLAALRAKIVSSVELLYRRDEHVEAHTPVLDGVFAELTPDRLQFHAAPPPSNQRSPRSLASRRNASPVVCP